MIRRAGTVLGVSGSAACFDKHGRFPVFLAGDKNNSSSCGTDDARECVELDGIPVAGGCPRCKQSATSQFVLPQASLRTRRVTIRLTISETPLAGEARVCAGCISGWASDSCKSRRSQLERMVKSNRISRVSNPAWKQANWSRTRIGVSREVSSWLGCVSKETSPDCARRLLQGLSVNDERRKQRT